MLSGRSKDPATPLRARMLPGSNSSSTSSSRERSSDPSMLDMRSRTAAYSLVSGEEDDEGEGSEENAKRKRLSADQEEEIELEQLRSSLDAEEAGLLGKRRGQDEPLDDGSDDPLSLVSKAVPETDDPTMPALTLRVIIIGSSLCVLGAAVSQLFFYKSNSPGFSAYFVILVSLPIGRWMARVLPAWTIRIPFLGDIDLNPGPFSIKEHLLVGVLASSGATSAYASDIINIQELFFHQHMSMPASLVLLLTTQTLGFGFAGLVHNILVKPVAMIYPGSLVTTSLFHTLHGTGSQLTRVRLRFFMIVFCAIFIYQFIPSLIAPSLSSIALLCLIDNRNPAFRVLSSGFKGFGFLNFSLDWTAVGTSGPLFQPWWAACNFYAGIGGMMYVVMPALYFSNFWQALKFPTAIGSGLYNKSFTKFKVDSVLNPDNTLDVSKWEGAKPLLLTPFFAITYGLSFAILTSMVTHVFLWHRKDVKRALFYPHFEDVHNQLMKAYHNVPTSWYMTVLLISLSASIWLVAAHDALQLPVWGLLLAILIALVFLVPVGVLKAVSDTSVGLNVITE